VADIPLGVLNANNNEVLIRSEVRTVDAKAVVSQTEPEDSGNFKVACTERRGRVVNPLKPIDNYMYQPP
jgi:hypothetical protein